MRPTLCVISWRLCCSMGSSQASLARWGTKLFQDKNVFTQFIISQHWDGLGSWNCCLWKTKICLSCIFNIMLVDDLATQGARASTATVLTFLSQKMGPTSCVPFCKLYKAGLTHCGLGTTNCNMGTYIWVNIGSGDGLLPDGTKPLPEPMLKFYQ